MVSAVTKIEKGKVALPFADTVAAGILPTIASSSSSSRAPLDDRARDESWRDRLSEVDAELDQISGLLLTDRSEAIARLTEVYRMLRCDDLD